MEWGRLLSMIAAQCESTPLFSTTDSTTSTPVESLSQAILPAELEDRVAKMKVRGGQKMP